MTLALLAQAAAGMSIIQIIVIAIVVAAVIAIAFAVAKHFGINIPPVIIFIFWIVVIAAVAIFAIKLLWGMM